MNAKEINDYLENNANYWEKRAVQSKIDVLADEDDYARRLGYFYDQANKQLDEKLAKVYQRYAKENNMTLTEAYQILPKKMETEYRNDLKDYMDKAQSNNPKYANYLANQSIMRKHSVLDTMKTEVRNAVYTIDQQNTQGKFLSKIYQNANYKTQYADGEPFAKIDTNKVQQVLEQDWGNGKFSDKIWKNKEKLVSELDKVMIDGLAIGESYNKMASKLAKKMEVSKSAAMRLIVTESARMQTEGALARYRETGVKKYKIVAVLDSSTSEICRHLDGNIVPDEEATVGYTLPPFHPWCRTTFTPYYEDNDPSDRVYRDPISGKTESGPNITYAEYLDEHLKQPEQARALVGNRNTLANLMNVTSQPSIIQPLPPQSYPTPKNINDLESEEEYEKVVSRLTDDEAKAIDNYSHKEYNVPLNQRLLNNEPLTSEMKKIYDDLHKAKPKMTQFQGISERTMKLDSESLKKFVATHNVGDVVSYKSFMSTGVKFSFDDKSVKYIIKSHSGVVIQNFSSYPEQREVLLYPLTQFTILKVDYSSEYDIIVYMEES